MDFQLKALGHWSHLYSRSSVWMTMCCSKLRTVDGGHCGSPSRPLPGREGPQPSTACSRQPLGAPATASCSESRVRSGSRSVHLPPWTGQGDGLEGMAFPRGMGGKPVRGQSSGPHPRPHPRHPAAGGVPAQNNFHLDANLGPKKNGVWKLPTLPRAPEWDEAQETQGLPL